MRSVLLDDRGWGMVMAGLVRWIALFLVAGILAGGTTGLAAQEPLAGRWTGWVERKGSQWPAELELAMAEGRWTVRLSLPQLGYFDVEQKSGTFAEDRGVVDFPFGLGEVELRLADDRLAGQLAPEGDEQGFHFCFERGSANPVTAEPFQFTRGEMEFVGERLAPSAGQPRGALLVLHGSSQSGPEVWSYRGIGVLLARMGFEVFLYDRRTGAAAPDLADLAADAKAAVDAIRAVPGREAVKVGLVGGSQAGWLAAAVAADHPELVGLIAISGWPAVSPGEQELQRIRHEFLADGFPATDIEAAAAYFGFYLYVARRQELWPALEAAAADVLQQKWGDFVETPRTPADLRWWSANQDFPAWDHLRRVQCPVFAAYGAADHIVPPAANAELLRQLVGSGGNPSVTIRIYPEADHRIELRAGSTAEGFRWPQLEPVFLRELEEWLRENSAAGDE